jgi:tetratricopeptide (TPR) repeat protein
MIGDLNEAANAFGKAVVLEPENSGNWYNYAQVLELQGRLDEAIIATKKTIELVSATGDTAFAEELNEHLKSLDLKKSQAAPK